LIGFFTAFVLGTFLYIYKKPQNKPLQNKKNIDENYVRSDNPLMVKQPSNNNMMMRQPSNNKLRREFEPIYIRP